jgi:hypothetical protein
MARGKIRIAAGCFALAVLAVAGSPLFDEAELDFVHQPSRTASKFLIESVAGGVAMLDYDNDGLPDLYFVNGAALRDDMTKGATPDKGDAKYWNRLYRNLGGGKFQDVTARAGVQGRYYGMGAAAADFDNDGYPDLYVTGYGGNQLFRNNGDGTFTDVTAQAGVRGGGWSTGAAWVDVDQDGRLDLAVVRYMQWDFDPQLWCGARQPGQRSYCNPDRFPPAAYLLFRNLGNGKFEDVSEASGFGKAPGKGLGIAIADYDLDGKIDIAVANDAAPQQLFHNLGSGRFAEVGFEANIAYDQDGRTLSGMGIDFDDYDDDGRPDLVVNALAQQRYALFRNTAGGFEYVSGNTGVAKITRNHSGWGMRMADFDNDGRKDIVVAQSHVMDNIQLTQPAVAYPEPMLLLRNTGAGFSGETFGAPRVSRGAAFGDLNNDGFLDFAVCPQLSRAVVFSGRPNGNHWLMVRLQGTVSNRDGIGARIGIATSEGRQFRTVSTAGSYLASNDPRAHFGLGSTRRVDRVEIQWPSGKRQSISGVAADQVLTVTEP